MTNSPRGASSDTPRGSFPLLKLVSKIENKSLGLFPAKAGVGDGLAVGAAVGLLSAVNQIALDHEALAKLADILIVAHAVNNVHGDTGLLGVFLTGICVVRIHYDCGICKPGLIVKRAKALVPVFIPLFASLIRRADELAVAMECRCYTGDNGRTSMNTLKYKARDILALVFSLALAVGIFFISKYTGGYSF